MRLILSHLLISLYNIRQEKATKLLHFPEIFAIIKVYSGIPAPQSKDWGTFFLPHLIIEESNSAKITEVELLIYLFRVKLQEPLAHLF